MTEMRTLQLDTTSYTPSPDDGLIDQLEAILSSERHRRRAAETVLRQIADAEHASARFLRSLAAEYLDLT